MKWQFSEVLINPLSEYLNYKRFWWSDCLIFVLSSFYKEVWDEVSNGTLSKFFSKKIPFVILDHVSKFHHQTSTTLRDICQYNLWSSYITTSWRHEFWKIFAVYSSSNGWQGKKRREEGKTKNMITWERKELDFEMR